MVSSEDIAALLRDCSIIEKAIFTCACAERAFAVLAVIASPPTVDCARLAMNRAWLSIRAPESLTADYEQLSALPEAHIDDSNDPRYYAMRALGILADAISAASEDGDDVAISCAGGALDLANDIAFSTGDDTLSSLELTAQHETLALLRNAHEPLLDEKIRLQALTSTAPFLRAARALAHSPS